MEDLTDTTRRRILRTAAAAGITGIGVSAASGSAAAQKSSQTWEDVTADLVQNGQTIGTFTGSLTINRFGLKGGDIVSSGTLYGTFDIIGGATETGIESFSGVTTALSSDDGCTILTLDLGPLDLELLGLRVQLSEIELDITGETGEGNLLGNLLCAVADLGSGSLGGSLGGLVQDVLGIVNRLLGSL